MEYKELKSGDIKEIGDQYLPPFPNGIWINVLLIGQPITEKEYRMLKFRRPIHVSEEKPFSQWQSDEMPEDFHFGDQPV